MANEDIDAMDDELADDYEEGEEGEEEAEEQREEEEEILGDDEEVRHPRRQRPVLD